MRLTEDVEDDGLLLPLAFDRSRARVAAVVASHDVRYVQLLRPRVVQFDVSPAQYSV